ncbi:MAG TPA: hypothetical protein VNQ99_13980 [Xanthobacteraceae bacterium]|nr:hypothetical protein [Xanthobacteraceae bacterium]
MNGVSPDLIGAVAAMLTTGCWVPQALKIIPTRETAAISLTATLAFAS